MASIRQDYIAAGGNRHPAAADWNGDLLAYGSGNNIAIWKPLDSQLGGVSALLSGHKDAVNAVKIIHCAQIDTPLIISGSGDKTVRVWASSSEKPCSYDEAAGLTEHQGSVNTVAVLNDSHVFVTGGADATLKVWTLDISGQTPRTNGQPGHGSQNASVSIKARLLQSISLKPRFFPLATALARLENGSFVLAVAGTTGMIQIYIQQNDKFILGSTLTGHEGWIRSLDFVREANTDGSDLLLASASQDKYIRLWRFHKGHELPAASSAASDPSLGVLGRSLSNKPHYIGEGASRHSITFEALLIGHEDWIYTAQWHSGQGSTKTPRLLTASADNSLAIWEREQDSGFWICTTRLGEISAQKGSTSATGSTGGFWIGLWSSDGDTVTSLGRTGSWRIWARSAGTDQWTQQVGTGGHTKDVKDLAWSNDGAYLLSTGSDQTTRLYAEWKHKGQQSWHEVSRPQIHGYDLNCIDALGATRFISGADEKLLRVFNKPKAVANLLSKLNGIDTASTQDLPDAANIPMLGLSNKAISTADSERDGAEPAVNTDLDEREAVHSTVMDKSTLDLAHPPFEDHLARHTLWPEHEKLYGHGYEISAVASSHDGKLVATACRASSLDHAVVRLYETREWREIKPSLTAHSLTVTSLAFSPDDRYLLTTGRDRQWAIFSRDGQSPTMYTLLTSNPKGHSRMILDCSWAPISAGTIFATAGRDKTVKIWRLEDTQVECKCTVSTTAAATAVSFYHSASGSTLSLACGTEEGSITIVAIDTANWHVAESLALTGHDVPSGATNALRWRPAVDITSTHDDTTNAATKLTSTSNRRSEDKPTKVQAAAQLAVASDDHSVRIYGVVLSVVQST